MDNQNKSVTVITAGLLLSTLPMSELHADETPFSASVFRTSQYQIADLDEEGCGGAMTEYRVVRDEPETTNSSEPNEPPTTEKTPQLDHEEERSFWSWLMGLVNK